MTRAPAITDAELTQRRRRAAEAAAERGLDGLLVWSRGGTSVDFYGDVLYLTGHHSPFPPNQDTEHWSARSYSALVLPVDGSPVLVVDLPEPPEHVRLDDVRATLRVPHGAAAALRDRGLDRGRLGLVGRDTLLRSQAQIIEDELGHPLSLTPADDLLERMRMIKSPAEVALLRDAAAVGVGWMGAMLDAVEAGRTEGDVIGEGLRYLAAHGGFPYDAAIASGDRSNRFFSRLSIPSWDADRRLEPGDLVHIDAWAAIDGYYTDFVRSTVVGRVPTAAQRELLEASVALIDDLVEATRPGVRIGDLYARGAAWLTEHGFGEHRGALDESGTDFGRLFPAFGHGVGLGLEPPWIVDGEPTVVEEGMCLALECLVGRPGVGGAGFEHDVIVGADGCEILTAGSPAVWWD